MNEMYDYDGVLELIDQAYEAINESHPIPSYCEEMDMTLFPVMVIAMMPDKEDVIACYKDVINYNTPEEEIWKNMLSDLQFVAKQGFYIPNSYAEATLDEIRAYMIEHTEEILGRISEECKYYIGEYDED